MPGIMFPGNVHAFQHLDATLHHGCALRVVAELVDELLYVLPERLLRFELPLL